MSGRCRCCNEVLEEWEMKTIDPLTGTYTDLCDVCIQPIELFDDDPWENSQGDPDYIYSEN